MSGTGGKAFCAGGDIVEAYKKYCAKGKQELINLRSFSEDCFLMNYRLSILKPLQVVFWNGIVMGAGIGISQNA